MRMTILSCLGRAYRSLQVSQWISFHGVQIWSPGAAGAFDERKHIADSLVSLKPPD
jgi:hypothetical protein